MTLTLKSLGLALLAVMGMATVVGSAKAEFDAQVTYEGNLITMAGSQIGEMVFTRGVPMTCETATFDSQTNSGETTITISPTYDKCHATGPFGETWPATIAMNGCDYVLHLTAETKEETHTYTALSDLVCPKESQVVIDVYFSHSEHTANMSLCTINVPEQKNLSTSDLTNKAPTEATPSDWIEAHINLKNITSHRLGSGACGPLSSSTGTLVGKAELIATEVLPSISIGTD